MPHYPDTAAAGKGKTCDNIDQRRLSRSIGAKQSKEFAGIDFEINVAQGMQCTETLVYLPDFDCRSHGESSVSNGGMTTAYRSAIWLSSVSIIISAELKPVWSSISCMHV